MIGHTAFSIAPDFGQFAKMGDWTNAWRFSLQELPSDDDLIKYLDGTSEVSFEALFGSAFFGVRVIGEPAHVGDVCIRCVDALRGVAVGKSFFEGISHATGISFIDQKMAWAEIGIVNSWHTHGPIVLAPPACSMASPDVLWQSISTSSLAADCSNRKAIEFVFESPLLHWFALPLSDPSDSSHALSESLFRSAYQYAEAIR